jgi:hypothetical protein
MHSRFEYDGQLGAQEEENNSRNGLYISLVIFIILFLTTVSFLIYFQFYAGHGKFRWTFSHRSKDYIALQYTQKQEDTLKAKITTLNLLNDSLKTYRAVAGTLFTTRIKGEVYFVQIGAFRYFDFSKYESHIVNFFVDKESGLTKLIIGGFDTFDEACTFRDDMKKIGIHDAFIIKKVDGQNVKFNQWCKNDVQEQQDEVDDEE